MTDDGQVSDPRPTGRPNARLRQTVGDMVRSMALVLIVVGVLVLLARTPEDDPVKVVDVGGPLAVATAMAPFEVLMPTQLDGYRATSARYETTEASEPDPAWHVGWVSPDTQYVQLGQSATRNPDFLETQVRKAEPTEVVVLGGRTWQRFESAPGTDEYRALVLTDGGSTTVLGGTESWTELERVAASMAPPTE